MDRFVATIASAERYVHAEGPVWGAALWGGAGAGDREGRALWVDIVTGDVHQATVAKVSIGSLDTAGRHAHAYALLDARRVCHVDGTVGAVLLGAGSLASPGPVSPADAHPELVLVAGTRFIYVYRGDHLANAGSLPEASDAIVRFNDAKVDPWGRILAGTMAFETATDAGALYRLDPDGTVTTLLPRVTISNGMGWSNDGAVMYYIDSATGGIDVFDYAASGVPRNRRRFVTVPGNVGVPDGMCIDALGRIWVAIWGGSQVRCYSPDGILVAVVDVDAPHVSSCAFVGEHLDLLLITTSRQGLSEIKLGASPNSGGLFLANVGVSGQPQARFGVGLLT